jgi:hypothetical protein
MWFMRVVQAAFFGAFAPEQSMLKVKTLNFAVVRLLSSMKNHHL